jgi:hypothetical protein
VEKTTGEALSMFDFHKSLKSLIDIALIHDMAGMKVSFHYSFAPFRKGKAPQSFFTPLIHLLMSHRLKLLIFCRSLERTVL